MTTTAKCTTEEAAQIRRLVWALTGEPSLEDAMAWVAYVGVIREQMRQIEAVLAGQLVVRFEPDGPHFERVM